MTKRTLSRERHNANPTERLRQSREHRQVGMESDPCEAAHAQRSEAVVVLSRPNSGSICGASTVEVRRVWRNACSRCPGWRAMNERQPQILQEVLDERFRRIGNNLRGWCGSVRVARNGVEDLYENCGDSH